MDFEYTNATDWGNEPYRFSFSPIAWGNLEG